jgi:Fic family protein
MGTGWLLADCMEARGKQELWRRQRPEVLRALREQATVESVESSNRIEGVTVARERLRPVVLGKARPRDRSEEELAGYRRALDWIFRRREPSVLNAEVVRKLHALAQKGSGGYDAGEWKSKSNEIIEILPGGGSRVRFVPVSAADTPEMMDELCAAYESARGAGSAGSSRLAVPPLLLVATTVFDFLCVHPFRDGNGRVSRLLTHLMLEDFGFVVGRFVSLERLVEESKAEYYEALERSSAGWHEGRHDAVPWWNFFLGMVRRGYREFEEAVAGGAPQAVKSESVRRIVLERVGRFRLGDLSAELPGVSRQLIKKVLRDLKGEGLLQLEGRGKGAWWRR